MVCPECNGAMKPLFTGFYCPNDCDRPDLKVKKKQEIIQAQMSPAQKGFFANVKKASSWKTPFLFPVAYPTTYAPAKGQCPDAMCRGKGNLQFSSFISDITGAVKGEDVYQCSICNKEFREVNNSGYPATTP